MLKQTHHGHALLFRQYHHLPTNMMPFSERDTPTNKVVCDFGSQHLGSEGGVHLLDLRGKGGDYAGGNLDAVADGFGEVEHWFYRKFLV